jgi:hypothetical protein
MNSITQARPRVKPGRSVRVSDPVNGGRALLITDGRERCGYYLTPIRPDFGTHAYRLEKFSTDQGTDPEADHYDVLLDLERGHHSCECKGWLRWHKPCKHIACLLALLQGGRL